MFTVSFFKIFLDTSLNQSIILTTAHNINTSSNSNLGKKEWSIESVMALEACGFRCVQMKLQLSPYDIYTTHCRFEKLSGQRQRQWVLDYLHDHTQKKDRPKVEDITFFISGKEVCFQVWLATLDLKVSRFYDIRSLYLNGVTNIARHTTKDPLPKTIEAMNWMEVFFTMIGDQLPDRGIVHLPSCLTHKAIYLRMATELREAGKINIISVAQFYKLWSTHFDHVTIPAVS